MKYSKITGVVGFEGGQVLLREGMSVDPAHPLVKARPDLFTEDHPPAELRAPGRPVERATAGPGERRATVGKSKS